MTGERVSVAARCVIGRHHRPIPGLRKRPKRKTGLSGISAFASASLTFLFSHYTSASP